ncbi:MAG: LytTR family DNA-binding domain-containing protein [Balneolaceae bacterium]|nr:LytTR family DNA-binding domain-containing protein [Balneolaceae bacterium]
MMPATYHILFWTLSGAILTLGFGSTFQNYSDAFFFVSFLLPVAIATSYVFNYYLVREYLLKKRYKRFILYTIYTIVLSLLLQMMVVTISFIVLANYNYGEMNPMMNNIFVLFTVIYLLVFLNSFVIMYQQVLARNVKIQELEDDVADLETDMISVRSNRQTEQLILDQIQYLESLGDYVKIHTTERVVTTRENISDFEESLPSYFIRTHRSFIVNQHHIDRFTSTFVLVNGSELPVSRTYKSTVMQALKAD